MPMRHDPLRSFLFLLVFLLPLAGCDGFPRDPENSLERIKTDRVLRVGAIFNSPWVTGGDSDQLSGVEGELVRGFAEQLDARVDTVWGGDQELFEALMHNELDIIVGGFSATNPWLKQVGYTNPFYINRTLIAAPPGQQAVSDIDGRSVALKPHSRLRQVIERKGGEPDAHSDPFSTDGLVAAPYWEIIGRGYTPMDIELRKDEQVIAVAPGENALLMELERYLFQHNDNARLDAALWRAAEQ